MAEKEYRLREALSTCGWPDRYLSIDGRDARIGWRMGRFGYRPWKKWQRWSKPKAFLPIDDFLSKLEAIRFDPVLIGDPGFSGLILPSEQIDQFPYGKFLSIFRPIEFGPKWWRKTYGVADGSMTFKLDNITLCFTHEVTVRFK